MFIDDGSGNLIEVAKKKNILTKLPTKKGNRFKSEKFQELFLIGKKYIKDHMGYREFVEHFENNFSTYSEKYDIIDWDLVPKDTPIEITNSKISDVKYIDYYKGEHNDQYIYFKKTIITKENPDINFKLMIYAD